MANTIFQVFYHVLSYVVNSALQYLKHVQVFLMYILKYFIKQSILTVIEVIKESK